MRHAYKIPQTIVQIRKKLPITAPTEPPPLWASAPTMVPQYARPASTVTTADMRNHHRARVISEGMTLPFVGVELFHQRNIFQVEEIEQADPSDASYKMDPAQEHFDIGLHVRGNVDFWSEERCESGDGHDDDAS